MLKKYFLAILLACSYHLAEAAVVMGVIKNAMPGGHVEVIVPHYYVDGRSDTYWAELDGQSTFSIRAEVPEPQLVFLAYNEERLPIFLEPDDTLTIRTDVFQFPIIVTFGGRSSANNRLLQQYFKENPQDYNEMNNLRFKIGQWWATVEQIMNEQMEALPPVEFLALLDTRKKAATALFDDFSAKNPDALTPAFSEWLSAEITYFRAYHLLLYGQIYANRHSVPSEFFDFLYESPTISNAIGSDWYRQFLQTLMARQLAKNERLNNVNFHAAAYELAGELLTGKPLAFFRSEMIRLALSTDRYHEIIPYYTNFLKTNEFSAYDAKVTEMYDKVIRVLPGVVAPTFSGKDVAGNVLSLDQFRGRVVYLNFWASWCGACLKKMELFNDYAAELNRKGVEIVNISIDENPTNWQASLTERAFKGHNLLASSGRERNIAVAYGVQAVPQYFIIGKDGAFTEKAPSSQPEDIKNQLINITRSQ